MKTLSLGAVIYPLGSVGKPLTWLLRLCICENVKKNPTFPDDFTRFFVIIREVVYINTR